MSMVYEGPLRRTARCCDILGWHLGAVSPLGTVLGRSRRGFGRVEHVRPVAFGRSTAMFSLSSAHLHDFGRVGPDCARFGQNLTECDQTCTTAIGFGPFPATCGRHSIKLAPLRPPTLAQLGQIWPDIKQIWRVQPSLVRIGPKSVRLRRPAFVNFGQPPWCQIWPVVCRLWTDFSQFGLAFGSGPRCQRTMKVLSITRTRGLDGRSGPLVAHVFLCVDSRPN